ncbi:MAG TPA: antibiotic biosynthesis monooxygenase [Allosphingosinicella sp.]|jgi:heme-degrading monooxygenase HmoA|nr:antibiotic biosynthesis monooxygenase [Allosphingosinicella sp.]
MVFEINEVEIAADEGEAFERAFAEAAPLLLQVRGCGSASLFRCIERPGTYQVRVGWERIEDHVEDYPTTEEADRIRALLLPLIRRARGAHFEEVPVPGAHP